VKPVNLKRFDEAVGSGRVEPLWPSSIRAIGPGSITYTDVNTKHDDIENDDVFAFIGGELPTKFLQELPGPGSRIHNSVPSAHKAGLGRCGLSRERSIDVSFFMCANVLLGHSGFLEFWNVVREGK
jgi:hypothetical protein